MSELSDFYPRPLKGYHYARIWDEKPHAQQGDQIIEGVVTPRVFNMMDNPHGIVVDLPGDSTGNFALAGPATYECLIHCPFFMTDASVAWLVDITSIAPAELTVLTGSVVHAGFAATGSNKQTPNSIIRGSFSIDVNTYFRVNNEVEKGGNNGLGRRCNFTYNSVDLPEIYAVAEFWKELR